MAVVGRPVHRNGILTRFGGEFRSFTQIQLAIPNHCYTRPVAGVRGPTLESEGTNEREEAAYASVRVE